MMRANKKIKIIFIAIFIMGFMFLSISCCTDYGYLFHYSVDGGNGEIVVKTTESFKPNVKKCSESSLCELNCSNDSYIVRLRGGKNGSRDLTFTAIPKDGYRVKEWLFNGEPVEENKTNSYTATVSYKDNYSGVITVEFENIPQ